MPRLPIHHITITYAGRELISPGADITLAEAALTLPWTYGTDTVGLVGTARAIVVDRGNATGTLTLPIVQDYPSIEPALTALIEQQAWADTHTTGPLQLHTGAATYSTPTGIEDFNASCIELDTCHLPSGYISAITIQCRSNTSAIAIKPRYLGIWKQDASGSSSWSKLAISENEELQTPGESRTWHFTPGVSIPPGLKARLILVDSPSAGWQTNYIFGLRVGELLCSHTNRTDMTVVYRDSNLWSPYGAIPQLTIHYTSTATIPQATLTYSAALRSIHPLLAPHPRGYRLTTEWEFALT